MVVERVQLGILSRYFGARRLYGCYAISTGNYKSVPLDPAMRVADRWNCLIRIPSGLKIGLVAFSIYSTFGTGTRLVNISIIPNDLIETVLGLDESGAYVPSTLWNLDERCKLLTMLPVPDATPYYMDISALKDVELENASLLVGESASCTNVNEYAEVSLIAIDKSIKDDPIIY